MDIFENKLFTYLLCREALIPINRFFLNHPMSVIIGPLNQLLLSTELYKPKIFSFIYINLQIVASWIHWDFPYRNHGLILGKHWCDQYTFIPENKTMFLFWESPKSDHSIIIGMNNKTIVYLSE